MYKRHILGCFDKPPVDAADYSINRHDHKRQVVVDHAQDYSKAGVDHGNIIRAQHTDAIQVVDQADSPEKLVQKTVVFQDGHPGIGPQQEIYPHGKHN